MHFPHALKSEWKAPHTHTQGMQGIGGKFQHFRLSLLPQYGGFLVSITGPVFNVSYIFCTIDMEYSILMQNQIIME